MLDRLTLDQLRVLVAVAETGNFSAAARRLGRVQSAISQSVATLEDVLGTDLFDRTGKTPKLSDAGRVILADARRLIQGAETLRARAESIAADVEPELSIAVDAMFPNSVLMASLKALSEAFPCLPVTVFTEGLGATEHRLRDGTVRLAIYPVMAAGPKDYDAEFLTFVHMVPVVAATHPLAPTPAPLRRDQIEPHVQLVLTDRAPLSQVHAGVISHRIWRFADIATRLEFLLAGFGWCNMPEHLVAPHIAAGRLVRLRLAENDGFDFPFHVVHERGRAPGRAGRWLIQDLRGRLHTAGRGSASAAERADASLAAARHPIGAEPSSP
jgi:DNA-binding transcriptional LysR family regulator